MDRQKVISIGAVVLVVAGLATYSFYGGKLGKSSEQAVMESPSVAKVNGVTITKANYDTQLANAMTAYKAQGIDVDKVENLAQIKTQVLNDLISNELVMQGIATEGIKATPEDIEKQYQAVMDQAGGIDKLKTQMVTSNVTEEQLRENIARQITVQAYLLKNIDISTITVTDEEITKFYNEGVVGQEKPPALKDIKEQIRQQLLTNKQQVLINSFVQTLREKAQVETTPM
ncbi:MAG: SurA N-terminal domain-containing protein [Minisyncoccia bacterium]